MSKDVKDFSNLLFDEGQTQFEQLAEGMEIDPTALLRRLHAVTITRQDITIDTNKVVVTVWGSMAGRTETGTGAEDLTGLHGREYANAIKAAETVAKRRLTTNLLGYGYKHSLEETANASFAAVEPQVPQAPGPVNNAPAAVVVDTREGQRSEITLTPVDGGVLTLPPLVPPGTIITVDSEKVSIPEFKLPQVPKVTEATLAGMHKESQALDAQPEPGTVPEPPPLKPATPMTAQAGFFDEPTPPGQPAPIQTSPIPAVAQASAVPWTAPANPPVPAAPSTTEVNQPGSSSAPSQATAETTLPPVPVQDIKVEPVVSTAPNQQQYRAIQVRCTKLVRDVLPKAGKGADALLVPYMRKALGTNELHKGSLIVWEETLTQLEAFTTAKDLAQFLNGGKVFTGK